MTSVNKLFLAITVTSFGSQVAVAAVPLWLFSKTGDGSYLASNYLVMAVVLSLVSFFGGGFLDQWDKKKWIITIESMAGLGAMGLVIGAIYDILWLIYFLSVCQMGLIALRRIAVYSYLPQLTTSEPLDKVNGRFLRMQSVTEILGPACGAFLLIMTSISTLWILDGLSYFLAAFLCLRIKPIAKKSNALERKTAFGWEICEGAKFAIQNPLLLRIILVSAFCMLGVGLFNSTYVYHCKEVLAASNSEINLLSTFWALGTIIGTFLNNFLRVLPLRKIAFSVIGMFVGYIFLALFNSLLALSLLGAFVTCFNVICVINTITLVQSVTPDNLRSRVLGFRLSAINVMGIAATALATLLVNDIPTPWLYLLASLFIFIGFPIIVTGGNKLATQINYNVAVSSER